MDQIKVCPICHANQTVTATNLILTLHPLFASCRRTQCQSCDSSWVINPPPATELEAYYNQVYKRLGASNPDLSLARCQALARWRFVLDAIQSLRHKTFSVCDVGAGYGCTYEVARHLGLPLTYSALEYSHAMKRHLADLGARLLDSLDGSFDLVWACSVLEHYADPDELLRGIRRSLTPNGVGVIEVPYADCDFKPDTESHLLFFSVQGLGRALHRHGFQVLRLDSVGPLRAEARALFQDITPRFTLKSQLKVLLPEWFIDALRFRTVRQKTVADDLARQDLCQRWQLEVYGVERIWIRAVFQA